MVSVSNDSVFDDSLCESFSCPVCFEFMTKKIFTCSSGHSFCHVCILKVYRCPICKVKIISRRNINLEKAAKKFFALKQHNLLPVKKSRTETLSLPGPSGENDMSFIPVMKRKIRRSWGGSSRTPTRSIPVTAPVSASAPSAATQASVHSHITCPFSTCCYFTRNVWDLRSHLTGAHPSKAYSVKKQFENQSETHMRVRLILNIDCTTRTDVLSCAQASFVIYIMKNSDGDEEKFLLNILTVSDRTAIYKFSSGTQSQFSTFYESASQANWGGINIPVSQLEREDNFFRCTLYIEKVATLYAIG